MLSWVAPLQATLNNADEVFHFDANHHVIDWWWNGTWNEADLTALTGAAVAVAGSGLHSHVNTRGSTDEIFFIDGSHHVDALWLNSTGVWHVTDVTAAAAAAAAGAVTALSSHFDTVGNVDQAFFLDGNQHVQALWWDGAWHDTDVTLRLAHQLLLRTALSRVTTTRSLV
jgi:hypothetical protein